MSIWWFGDPWPSETRRARLCESDDTRLPVPDGAVCVGCDRVIGLRDHGVLTAASRRVWQAFTVAVGGGEQVVCCYHLTCWLSEVVGDVLSADVVMRMPGRRDEVFALLQGGDQTVGEVGGWRTTTRGDASSDGANAEGASEGSG